MKTFLYLLILGFGLVIYPKLVLAQNIISDSNEAVKPFKNSVYAELGGNGIVGSINYERLFYSAYRPTTIVAMRLGFMYLPYKGPAGEPEYMQTIPWEVSVFWGKKAIKPEIGFGATYFQSYDGPDRYSDEGYTEFLVMPVFRLGIRYDKPDKHMFWRLGFTPALIIEASSGPPQLFPWGGLSFGYKFGRK